MRRLALAAKGAGGTATPCDGVASQLPGRSTLGGSLADFSPNSLAAGDVDNDGDLDLLVGDKSGRPLLFVNTGARATPFSVQAPILLGPALAAGTTWGNTVGVALADANGDGRLDAFVARARARYGYLAPHVKPRR